MSRDSIRALLVKNCTNADFCKYAIEVNGEKSEASLKTMSPFVSKIQNESGPVGGIALFSCEVRPAVQVSWYFGNQKISRSSFRYDYIIAELSRSRIFCGEKNFKKSGSRKAAKKSGSRTTIDI